MLAVAGTVPCNDGINAQSKHQRHETRAMMTLHSTFPRVELNRLIRLSQKIVVAKAEPQRQLTVFEAVTFAEVAPEPAGPT